MKRFLKKYWLSLIFVGIGVYRMAIGASSTNMTMVGTGIISCGLALLCTPSVYGFIGRLSIDGIAKTIKKFRNLS